MTTIDISLVYITVRQRSKCLLYKLNSRCGHLLGPPPNFQHYSQCSLAYNISNNSSHKATVSL